MGLSRGKMLLTICGGKFQVRNESKFLAHALGDKKIWASTFNVSCKNPAIVRLLYISNSHSKRSHLVRVLQ